MTDIYAFIRESNHIEGIHREPTHAEIEEFKRFMALEEVTIPDLEQFVRIYQPKKPQGLLRRRKGLNVRVGEHRPAPGGPDIVTELQMILEDMHNAGAFLTHQRYEDLHPFTDGNGRSGRMLWLWQVRDYRLGFMHRWYYQSLDAFRKK